MGETLPNNEGLFSDIEFSLTCCSVLEFDNIFQTLIKSEFRGQTKIKIMQQIQN